MTRQEAINFLKSQIAKFQEQLDAGEHIAHNEMCIKYAKRHIAKMEGAK